MTTILNKRYSKTSRPRVHYRHTETDKTHGPIPDRRHVTQVVTEEQEAAMVAKYAFALAILGITPLIVYLIVYYFFPDLLLFLDPPSK